MSAVWVACLSAHFGTVSRTPTSLLMVSFRVILFSVFSFTSYVTACSLPKCSAEKMHASPLNCSQHITEGVDASGKQARADHVGLGWGELAMQMWTSINLENCLKLALHKSFLTSCFKYLIPANPPCWSQHGDNIYDIKFIFLGK